MIYALPLNALILSGGHYVNETSSRANAHSFETGHRESVVGNSGAQASEPKSSSVKEKPFKACWNKVVHSKQKQHSLTRSGENMDVVMKVKKASWEIWGMQSCAIERES